MKLVTSWLKELIDIDLTPQDLAQKLTGLGIEVAAIESKGADFEGVFVAQIVKIENHPDSDHLHLATLELGAGQTQRVVCGAPNIEVGQKVPLARVGARLGTLILKPAVIRGIASEGMICSSDELGLTSTRAKGILVLDQSLPLGTDLRTLYAQPDTILELEITSNRPDLLSHLGIARELGILLDKPVRTPAVTLPATTGNAPQITVTEEAACPRYLGRSIRGVKNVPSPLFIQERLSSLGLNPKNALVDITNYVMFELGHPLHAFDLRAIKGNAVTVRYAKDGEKLPLLNGEDLTLNSTHLVIADAQNPTALAGIMGGKDSAIAEDTQDIFIESAYFTPTVVNKSVKKLGLSSDSSQRFERGTDIEGARLALERATDLFLQCCGGAASPVTDVYPQRFQNPVVSFTPAQINAILGTQIEAAKLKTVFERLALKLDTSKEEWAFQAPPHRRDLNHKWDLAEEAARFIGYDAILPVQNKASIRFADRPKSVELSQALTEKLVTLGFCECKNLDFIGEKDLSQFSFAPANCIKIKNAMAQGWDYLRPSLLPSLLKNVNFNLSRGNQNLALFEITKTFTSIKNFPVESYTAAGVLTGCLEEEKFFASAQKPVDFYLLKGLMNALFSDGEGIKLAPSVKAPAYIHPKICMDITLAGKTIGQFGKLHPLTLKNYGIKTQDVWMFEFALKPLEKAFSLQDFRPIKEAAVLPPSLRDLSVVVDSTVTYAQTQSALHQTGLDVKMTSRLIDVYQGDRLPEGKKSMTFSLVFSLPDRTLKDAETDAAFNKIVAHLGATLGATLR